MSEITKDEFQSKVLDSEGTVLVKFGAEWCGPCKMMDKSLEQLEESVIYKIDVDKEIDLMNEYKVRGVPTLLKFVDGQLEKTHIGVLSLKQLKEF